MATPTTTGLLAGGWPQSGTLQTASGVQVRSLGRAISTQAAPYKYQPDPPIAFGPVVAIDGGIQLAATMTNVSPTKAAFLHLYQQVPEIYDEWRRERQSVRIGIVAGVLQVAVWNGRSNNPVVTTYGNNISGTVQLRLTTDGSRLTRLSLNGVAVPLALPSYFGSGKRMFFGLDGDYTLAALSVTGTYRVLPAPEAAALPADYTGLRTASERRTRPVPIGTAVATLPLLSDGTYRNILGWNFNMVTPENDMKWQFIEPQRGVYAYTEADFLVDWALRHNMKIHGHNLVWREALPAWVRAAPATELESIMISHITNVVSHFKGRVAEWDVVNEPFSDDNWDQPDANIWYKAMGAKSKDAKGRIVVPYIDKALIAAHAADPDAGLYLNEYGLEEDGSRWKNFLGMVTSMKERGIPITGVGFQYHEDKAADRVPASVWAKKVQQLAAIGLKARISELDVTVESDDEETTIQAPEYASKLRAALDNANVTAFSVWGQTDAYGSGVDTNDYPAPAHGDALPWNESQQPKEAVAAMLKELGR